MDLDNPHLLKAHEAMTSRVREYDDRIVAVLKGNLGLEQLLIALLRKARRKWKRPFAGKIDKCEKLFLPEIDETIWAVARAGNNLRNAVAHGDPEGAVAARVADLRKAFLASVYAEQRPGIQGMTDVQMISQAFFHCGSYVVVATDNMPQAK